MNFQQIQKTPYSSSFPIFCSAGAAVSSDGRLQAEERHRASCVLSCLPAILENSQLR